jgi:hypothetical protein
MKNRFHGKMLMAEAVGLVLLVGCSNQSAQQEPVRAAQVPAAAIVVSKADPPAITNVVADPSPPILFTSSVPASVTSQPSPANPAGASAPQPAVAQRGEQALPPGVETLSPAVQEVIKMAQAGIHDEVILTYVENAKHGFNLNSDGIVYLNDLGLGASVVTAMIQRDAQLGITAAVAPPPEQVEMRAQTQPVSNVAAAPGQPMAAGAPMPPPTEAAPDQPVDVAAPAQETEVAYFYDSLSPYGSWMYVSGYGWCWQPTVVVASTGWTPYCDAGRWYWSDSGWYWHSDYSWGWAPFHYGRWFHHGQAGWMWCPGTVWGPSWVSWRYSAGYCGWAPLPPAAGWSVGFGFTYHGAHAGLGCDFGLSYAHYAWVPTQRFCEYNLRRYAEPHEYGHSIFQNSTVVNNYVVNNTTIINHGVGRDTIARNAGNALQTVSIRERPAERSPVVRPERLQKEGFRLFVERPALPKTPSALPANVANRTPGRSIFGSPSPATSLSPRSPGAGGSAPSQKPSPGTHSTGPSPAVPAAPRGEPQPRSGVTGMNSAGRNTPNAASQAAPQPNGSVFKPGDAGQPARSERDMSSKSIIMVGPNRSTPPQTTTSGAAPKPNVSVAPRAEPRVSTVTTPNVRSEPGRSLLQPSHPAGTPAAPPSTARSSGSMFGPSSTAGPGRPAPSYPPAPVFTPATVRAVPSSTPAPSYSAPVRSAPAYTPPPTPAPSHPAPASSPAPARSESHPARSDRSR